MGHSSELDIQRRIEASIEEKLEIIYDSFDESDEEMMSIINKTRFDGLRNLSKDEHVFFEKHIEPIINDRVVMCLGCNNDFDKLDSITSGEDDDYFCPNCIGR